jgi:hypothetical protein
MVKDQKGFSAVEVILYLIILISIAFVGVRVHIYSQKKSNSNTTHVQATDGVHKLARYTVPGEAINGSPLFAVNFYENSSIQPKNGLVYLISKFQDGTQSSVWVYKLKSEVPVCSSGGTSFTAFIMSQSVPACYRNDRIIYTAEIALNNHKYQINLVSSSIIWPRAIFPGLYPSIVTDEGLNCGVRDGNRCFPFSMETNQTFGLTLWGEPRYKTLDGIHSC